MTSPPSLPPRGWYPDPGGSDAWRWWDGGAWTDDLEPFARAPVRTVAPLLDKEAQAEGRLVPLGFALLALGLVLGAVVRAFEASYLTATWHWFVHAYDVARRGGGPPTSSPPQAPAGAQLLSTFVVSPAQIIGLVLLLTFQHPRPAPPSSSASASGSRPPSASGHGSSRSPTSCCPGWSGRTSSRPPTRPGAR